MGGLLGLFMIAACLLATLLEFPDSPVQPRFLLGHARGADLGEEYEPGALARGGAGGLEVDGALDLLHGSTARDAGSR